MVAQGLLHNCNSLHIVAARQLGLQLAVGSIAVGIPANCSTHRHPFLHCKRKHC